MKKTLPDFIKQNENLRQILLAQEGGIMKYLAEHLDANGTAELFRNYQEQCAEEFFEKNKWDLRVVWEGDNMKRAALGGEEHLKKEIHYISVLEPCLTEISEETVDMIDLFTKLYLSYAYKQNRLRWHPNGLNYMDTYREILEMYNPTGLAYKCMMLILREHHSKEKFTKTKTDLWNEFLIRQWSDHLKLGVFALMRHAVADMLIGKSDEQCRQMAIDTMDKLRVFSQMIYTDVVVKALRDINFTKEADQRESDGEWLRNTAQRAIFEETSEHLKIHSMRYYFSEYVFLLREVGRIWAAQLLVHNIDMKELERKACCILQPDDAHLYYVDKYFSNDLPDKYCIATTDVADKLLAKIGSKPKKDSYLEVVDKSYESETRNKLSKAYIQLRKEGFLSDDSTTQIIFIDVMMNQKDKKIVWLKDPKQNFLRTLMRVFLGKTKSYSYPAILKINNGGSYADFIQKHFVNEERKPINLKTNGHEVGIKEVRQFERIINATYNR